MLRNFLSIVALIFITVATPADARTLDEIIKDGAIRIGVNPNFPPMSYFGMTNQLEGFDIDIGNEIADALGVEAEFVITEGAQRVPFLLSNRVDIALGAMTRTPERAKLIGFTVPLHTESMVAITTDKINVQTWRDLDREDITLVNIRGNFSVSVVKEKLPKPKRLLVDTHADTIRAIAQGRADALVENPGWLLSFMNKFENINWRILDEPVLLSHCSIGVGKGNQNLRQYLNVLLYDLHSSGTINEIWKKWYGAPMTIPVNENPYF